MDLYLVSFYHYMYISDGLVLSVSNQSKISVIGISAKIPYRCDSYDLLQYPLLFLHSTDGWHVKKLQS